MERGVDSVRCLDGTIGQDIEVIHRLGALDLLLVFLVSGEFGTRGLGSGDDGEAILGHGGDLFVAGTTLGRSLGFLDGLFAPRTRRTFLLLVLVLVLLALALLLFALTGFVVVGGGFRSQDVEAAGGSAFEREATRVRHMGTREGKESLQEYSLLGFIIAVTGVRDIPGRELVCEGGVLLGQVGSVTFSGHLNDREGLQGLHSPLVLILDGILDIIRMHEANNSGVIVILGDLPLIRLLGSGGQWDLHIHRDSTLTEEEVTNNILHILLCGSISNMDSSNENAEVVGGFIQ